MVKAEMKEKGIQISVIGVADDTMNEVASIVETIVANCIKKGGTSLGREAYFDIFSRAAMFIEDKTGVDVTDDSIDYRNRVKENPIELLEELLGKMRDLDADAEDSEDSDTADETEDDIPDFLF